MPAALGPSALRSASKNALATHAQGWGILVINPGEKTVIAGSLGVPIDVVVVGQEEAARRGAVRGTIVERALREGRVLAEP